MENNKYDPAGTIKQELKEQEAFADKEKLVVSPATVSVSCGEFLTIICC